MTQTFERIGGGVCVSGKEKWDRYCNCSKNAVGEIAAMAERASILNDLSAVRYSSLETTLPASSSTGNGDAAVPQWECIRREAGKYGTSWVCRNPDGSGCLRVDQWTHEVH
jgi:hypothetical protein